MRITDQGDNREALQGTREPKLAEGKNAKEVAIGAETTGKTRKSGEPASRLAGVVQS